ncbi:MAG: hypothetical protein R3F30_09445 [Planctomycetota bacterium]
MKDTYGQELGAPQQALVEVYDKLLAVLREHGGELAPYEERNAKKALACLWQVANGLDMDPGQLYDLGV